MEIKPNTENKVICRKCGGNHFTIKCGKEKVSTEVSMKVIETKPTVIETNTVLEKKSYEHREKRNYDYSNKEERKFRTTYRVKLSELPKDMTEEEMMQLTADWGHIVRLRVLNYHESSTAYIDFGFEDQADYFVKAIDKTPFDSVIINACRVESFRSH